MKHYEPDCRDTYQTGSTNPPKSHRGIIAVLLILVTVLSSFVTVLSMMNIRLFNLLEEQTKQVVTFEPEEQVAQVDTTPQAVSEQLNVPALGLTCEEIAGLYRSYHALPQGLYISQVEYESIAHKADVQAGDILVAVDGQPITEEDVFIQYVQKLQPGDFLTLTVFREEEEIVIPMMIP